MERQFSTEIKWPSFNFKAEIWDQSREKLVKKEGQFYKAHQAKTVEIEEMVNDLKLALVNKNQTDFTGT